MSCGVVAWVSNVPIHLGEGKTEGFPSPTLEGYKNFIEALCENKPIFLFHLYFQEEINLCANDLSYKNNFSIFVKGLNSVPPSLFTNLCLKGREELVILCLPHVSIKFS